MPLTSRMDPVDRQIIAALQVNGRASWRRVSAAIEAAESTVTRRGQQLLADEAVAVTAVVDHLRCGLGISVFVRLRAKPGRALSVGQSVARHEQARFVSISTGTLDVTAEVVVEQHGDIVQIVADLGGLDDVLETESLMVMRKFRAFEEWEPGRLSETAAEILRDPRDGATYDHRAWTRPEQLTQTEFAIAQVLADDGRATYAAIAQEVGVSESTAARRVESLVERGCLRFRTLFSPTDLGYDVEFLLLLAIDPAHLEEVGERMSALPSTRYVSATTGSHSLFVQGIVRGYGDLYSYTTDVVGQLPGVRSAQLNLQVRVLKRAWIQIDDTGHPQRGDR